MTLDQFLDSIIKAGAVAGALIAIGVIVRWAVAAPLKHYIRDEVLVELKPNGGSSIKDVVTRLDKQVTQMAADNREMTTRVAELTTDFAVFRAVLRAQVRGQLDDGEDPPITT